MTQYLMIENKGVAPVEGFTLLGVGTTGSCGIDGAIGMFATGAKQSINLLLREGIPPVVYTDLLCLEFGTEGICVDEYLNRHKFQQVTCRITGKDMSGRQINRTEKLGWTIDFGQHDWTDVKMAVREFISNAIDRTLKEMGDFNKDITIEVVPQKSVRAKKGYTRVFIPINEELKGYYLELDKYFLHWFKGVNTKESGTLKKACRETSPGAAVIYKKGVFVRELWENIPSIWDYNINDLKLDECRNADNYTVKTYIAYELAYAGQNERETLIRALKNGGNFIETSQMSAYDLNRALERKQSIKQDWLNAWNRVCGPRAVACSDVFGISSFVEGKGYTPITIKSEAWKKFLVNCGVPSETSVLTYEEQEGITLVETPNDLNSVFNEVWNHLVQFKMTGNKDKPGLKTYAKNMEAGQLSRGYYKNGTIYVHQDIAGGRTRELLKTVLEECAHYITGATDASRDFQEFAFSYGVEMMMQNKPQ